MNIIYYVDLEKSEEKEEMKRFLKYPRYIRELFDYPLCLD